MFRKSSLARQNRSRRLRVESLESRKLMTVNCFVDGDGILQVRGDDNVDKVTVLQSGANIIVRSVDHLGVTKNFNAGSNVQAMDIRTFGGNDVVNNNTRLIASINGGDGNDTLSGGSDTDLIYGEAGDDTIRGNNGSDYLYGGRGNDVIRAGSGNDFIEGDDAILNRLSPSEEGALPYTNNDVIYGGEGQDDIYGQLGRDRIYGGGSGDTIDGGRGADVIYGDDAFNSNYIPEDADFAGDDQIYGGDGNDQIFGGYGEDFLYGSSGNDKLYGGFDNDKLFGESGVDFLMGESGDDFLDAGSLSEVDVYGGDGNDFNALTPVVNGARFNDIAQGGSNNCFILASMSAAVARGIDLASRITYTGNGWYSVALFKRESSGAYSPTTINVFFAGTLRSTDPTAHFRGQEGESWTVIMNRALATLLNVNLETTTGGYAGNVLAAITGRSPVSQTWIDNSGTMSLQFNDPVLDRLFQVGNALPTIVGTRNTNAELDSTRFAADHVYVVHSVFISGSTFNPVTRMFVPQYSVLLYNLGVWTRMWIALRTVRHFLMATIATGCC